MVKNNISLNESLRKSEKFLVLHLKLCLKVVCLSIMAQNLLE